jgi:hypothetical protein
LNTPKLLSMLVLTSVLVGCNMTGSPTSKVPLIPVIWANPISGGKTVASRMTASKAIAIAPSTQSEEAQFECSFGPVITSFQSDTSAGGLGVGDSFQSNAYGGTVTTTISASGTDTVFNGVFNADSLNVSNYRLTLHNNSTFDFIQTIVYAMGGNFYIMAVVKINDGVVNGDGSYSGTATGYVYYYDYPGDADKTARYAIGTGALVANSTFFGFRELQSTAPNGSAFTVYPGTVVLPDTADHVAQISTYIQGISVTMLASDFLTFHDSANAWARCAGNPNADPYAQLVLSDPMNPMNGRGLKDVDIVASALGLTVGTINGEQYINYVWTANGGK